jgi:uncharacterized protein (TIGR01319 family)
VVVAGNADAAAPAVHLLTAARVDAVVADNVVPQIGVLHPDSARTAIRETFLSHVIGGKHLSASRAFLDMVLGPTPEVVLTAVELLAAGLGSELPGVGDVAVVDVGGATTDVHTVVEIDPEDGALSRSVVATTRVNRSVEGDLGVRWSALTTVERGLEAGLVGDDEGADLTRGARGYVQTPGAVPSDAAGRALDLRLAEVAIGVAMRRHAGRQRVAFGPGGRLVERDGVDLREVDLLIGSGGVLRHAPAHLAEAAVRSATGDPVAGGWLLPRAPRVSVDRMYVLAAAGLLAKEHPRQAYLLARRYLSG